MFRFLAFPVLLLTPEAPYTPLYALDAGAAFDGEAQYVECVSLIAEAPDLGRQGAQRWVGDGGGAPAIHCLAIADLAEGFPRLAAARLTDLADRADAGDALTRAMVLGEASLAWLDANDATLAIETVEDALARAPDYAPLKIIAAKAYAAAKSWRRAVEAVTEAESAGVATLEGRLIRARANKALGAHAEAAEDVVAALKLEPTNLDALVLRGELIQAGIEIKAHIRTTGE